MASMENNDELPIFTGMQNIVMNMSTGDARIQMSIDNQPFSDIPDTVKTADASFNMSIPASIIRAVITGNAKVFINKVKV